MALYAESGDSWAPTPGNKLYEREQLTAKKSQEVRRFLALPLSYLLVHHLLPSPPLSLTLTVTNGV